MIDFENEWCRQVLSMNILYTWAFILHCILWFLAFPLPLTVYYGIHAGIFENSDQWHVGCPILQ